MRIERLLIGHWRNFKNLDIHLDQASAVVALIGENGTGKSNICELVCAVANCVGISSGVDSVRGDTFKDPHKMEIVCDFSTDLSSYFGDSLPHSSRSFPDGLPPQEHLEDWTGRIIFRSETNIDGRHEQSLEAIPKSRFGKESESDGQEINNRRMFADWLVKSLQQTDQVHFLQLDADRAYQDIPRTNIDMAITTDWQSGSHRKSRSFARTKSLYEEWRSYAIGLESRAGRQMLAEKRKAESEGRNPEYSDDPFQDYRSSIIHVLPHLEFLRVDNEQRTLIFSSRGSELRFEQLSGGEREIAFLLGQLHRFKLEIGVFVIDEPELHLHPELIRTWVSHLQNTVVHGQVWLTTHSFEAIETVGSDSVILLERQSSDDEPIRARTLVDSQLLVELLNSMGQPAFSIYKKPLVYIEGERHLDERRRFYRLLNNINDVVFIEGGNCDDIFRKRSVLHDLAQHEAFPLRTGGVVDKDHKTDEQCAELKNQNLHVLEVHEIENIFLEPETINLLISKLEIDNFDPKQEIPRISDETSGLWVYQKSAVRCHAVGELSKRNRTTIIENSYPFKDNDPDNLPTEVITAIHEARSEYSSLRDSGMLWQHCNGKQVLNSLVSQLGLSKQIFEQLSVNTWRNGEADPPAALVNMRAYINSL